jgi:hypothetical protein
MIFLQQQNKKKDEQITQLKSMLEEKTQGSDHASEQSNIEEEIETGSVGVAGRKRKLAVYQDLETANNRIADMEVALNLPENQVREELRKATLRIQMFENSQAEDFLA